VKPVKELGENGSSERGQGERAGQVDEAVKGETGPGGLWSRAWLGVWRRKWLDVWSHEGWVCGATNGWVCIATNGVWTSRRRLPWTCGVDRGQRAYEGAGSP
jgi:hypothetical protein